MNKKGLLLALAALVIVVLAAIGLSSTQMTGNADREEAKTETASAEADVPELPRQVSQICGSNATYARLKEVAFEEAFRLRNDDPTDLDTLAANSVVRMENPVVQNQDDGLGTTVCAGRFVLELPPGAERGFGGERRLVADVEYAAQRAADGSGLVYQLNGADAVIQRLAAFSLSRPPQPVPPREVEFAEAAPVDTGPVASEPDDEPVAAPAPRPEPRPTATPKARAEARPTPRPRPTEVAKAERVEPIAPRATSRPSFNCRYARTRGEIMVCDSDRLAAKDRAMSSEFYQALANSDPRTRRELRRSRDRFLAYRDRCRDEACVAEAYDGRVQEIRDIVELAPQ